MKGSDFGAFPPSSVGDLMYAKNEDGSRDGLWRDSADSEEDAIKALRELCESDLDGQMHGYLADCVEAEIDGPDAELILEQVSEWAHERYGEAVDNWPDANKEQVSVLQARLDKVFGEWLTEFSLWPAFCGIDNVREVKLQPEEPEDADGRGP